MENVIRTTKTKTINNEQVAILSWFDNQATSFEKSRFGAMAMMIGFQSCWGSIAAGLTYSNESIIALAIGASFTMMNNAVLLAQGPAKWCVGIFYAAVIANSLVILSSFL